MGKILAAFLAWVGVLLGTGQVMQTLKPVATPGPYEELTIPYLRSREYKSELGEMTQWQKESNYTSYLTSYDSDGLRVRGLLTIPEGEPPEGGWPGIVFVHGYIAPSTYRTTEKYGDYVDYLARNGFVVFKIDLRGHGDSEGSPGGAYYSSDYVIDTLNARAALATQDFVDAEKISLWGHSMAGNVVFRSFVVAQDIPAVVIWAGAVYTYSDFGEYGISDNSYRPPSEDSVRRAYREGLRAQYGEFNSNNDFWKKVAPTNYLDGVSGAIQINHAVNDDVVDIGYSRNLMDVLEVTQIHHELMEYESGGHNLSGEVFTRAMQNTVRFYRSFSFLTKR